jgi:hypothetical protein
VRRIIEFGRFALENRRARGQGKPETFAFLGFTHIVGRTREGSRLIRPHTRARAAECQASAGQGQPAQDGWRRGAIRRAGFPGESDTVWLEMALDFRPATVWHLRFTWGNRQRPLIRRLRDEHGICSREGGWQGDGDDFTT